MAWPEPIGRSISTPAGDTDTVVSAIQAAITGAAIAGVTVRRSGQRLGLSGARNVQQSGTTLTIEGDAPARSPIQPRFPSSVHVGMTANEVALAAARALNAHYVVTVNGKTDIPNLFTSVKVDGPTLYVIGQGHVQSWATVDGVLRPAGRLSDSQHDRSCGTRAGRTPSKGIYIDDFVIGFAERGEIVSGARSTHPMCRRRFVQPARFSKARINSRCVADSPTANASFNAQTPLPAHDVEGDLPRTIALPTAFQSRRRIPAESRLARRLLIDDGLSRQTFEFDLTGDPSSVSPGNVPVDVSAARTATEVAQSHKRGY